MNKDLKRRLVELDEYVKRAITFVNGEYLNTPPTNYKEIQKYLLLEKI